MSGLEHGQVLIAFLLSVAALCGVVVGWFRWARPLWRGSVRTGVAIRDSLIGRDAVYDSITGREIAPAQPGLGVRMEAVEQAQLETRDAVQGIAELLRSQHTQDERLDDHEKRLRRLELGA